MMDWSSLELPGWGVTGPEALPTAATAGPPALVIARARPAVVALVCRVCGPPWVDGACSFMPSQHERWGPAWER